MDVGAHMRVLTALASVVRMVGHGCLAGKLRFLTQRHERMGSGIMDMIWYHLFDMLALTFGHGFWRQLVSSVKALQHSA